MAEKRPVAPRNDLAPTVLVKERPGLFKQDPDFVYQWFTTDPANPSYAGKYLRQQELGDEIVGWTVGDPWEVVSDATDPALQLLGIRDDQGKGVDTVRRQGRKILMRTTRANARKWSDVTDARVNLQEKGRTAMAASEVPGVREGVSYDERANPSDMLARR